VLSNSDKVLFVYADQDAVKHILDAFQNIPYKKDSHCLWRGKIARFIVENL